MKLRRYESVHTAVEGNDISVTEVRGVQRVGQRQCFVSTVLWMRACPDDDDEEEEKDEDTAKSYVLSALLSVGNKHRSRSYRIFLACRSLSLVETLRHKKAITEMLTCLCGTEMSCEAPSSWDSWNNTAHSNCFFICILFDMIAAPACSVTTNHHDNSLV